MTARVWASRALTIQFIILVRSSRLYHSHDEVTETEHNMDCLHRVIE